MSTSSQPIPLGYESIPPDAEPARSLMRQLLLLSGPILAEHLLHLAVVLTDTWLANHLPPPIAPSAAAAVGSIGYILWFVGLIVGTIGTGATAIIARAKGARHRSLANSVTGQSIASALVLGAGLGLFVYLMAAPIARVTGLTGPAYDFALSYLRVLAISLPFSTTMFVANACLRGDGDTLSPAIAMIAVDLVNIAFSGGLTYGWLGLPALGFDGIAIGTSIAYVAGGLIQFTVLVSGRRSLRLHLHRMRPHWLTLKRLFRIGIPAGVEGFLSWAANFVVIIIINRLDRTAAVAAAHVNAVRIEAISYMVGFAVATAAATLVGQSLGMKAPRRATRCAYLAYALGGGAMTLCGLFFILCGHLPARWIAGGANDIADLTARCLFITGFIQVGFAASAIFGGALRGAGDTVAVMLVNLASVLGVRLLGVLFVTQVLGLGLVAIWLVLSAELLLRGTLIYLRFLHGGWRTVRV